MQTRSDISSMTTSQQACRKWRIGILYIRLSPLHVFIKACLSFQTLSLGFRCSCPSSVQYCFHYLDATAERHRQMDSISMLCT